MFLVWAALGLSIVLLTITRSSTGFDLTEALADHTWTPPGAVIGAVWTILYTLMGVSLWAINHVHSDLQPRLRLGCPRPHRILPRMAVLRLQRTKDNSITVV